MKKILCIILCFCMFLPFSIKADEVDLAPNAGSAILMEFETGEIIFEKNSHEKLHPASMTKIMSMLIIMEHIDKGLIGWDDVVTASENASGMGGSQILLETGEKMKVSDLFKGIAVASGNDAVVAMSEYIAGTEEAFVKMMNEKVKELGLNDTNFKNVHGLDDANHYSSAYDMSLIAKELIKHEKILEFSSTYEDYLRKDTKSPFWLVNTNKLVKFYSGADGLKTGFTKGAGYCLTATAKKDNMRLITVVMNEPTAAKRSSDTTKMLDYGYNIYTVKNIVDNNTKIKSVKVELGKKTKANITSKETITILSKKTDEDRNITYKTNISTIIAPVKKGDTIGTIDIIENNKVISNIDATVTENIDKANIFTIFIRNLQEIIKGDLKI